jgi:serine/threonine protein kinase
MTSEGEELELGSGEFCSVVRTLLNDQPVAMKRIKTPAYSDNYRKHLDCLFTEYSLLCLLHHPNIVAVQDSTPELGYFYMEMFDQDLMTYLNRNLPSVVTRMSMLKQVCLGLAFVHANGFVHLDIKPENILVRGDRVALCDFGYATAITPSSERWKLLDTGDYSIGSPLYMAPERWRHPKLHVPPSDVWSLAITGQVVMNRGAQPWPQIKRMNELQAAIDAKTLILKLARPPDCCDKLWSAFQACLHYDYKSRGDLFQLTSILSSLVIQNQF